MDYVRTFEKSNSSSQNLTQPQFISRWFGDKWKLGHAYDINCQWEPLRQQLLMQWTRLTLQEVDRAGPSIKSLAHLIYNRYGLRPQMVENYLRNFERMLPLLSFNLPKDI